MVRKLLKYDISAFARIMLPVYIAVIGVAAFYRIVSIFENDSEAFGIFNASSITILVIAILASFIICYIFSVIRFYKNLFTTEGYLSFSLPVTVTSHILSKLLTSVIFDLLTVLVSFAAFSVATAGELFVEIMKAFAYISGNKFNSLGITYIAYIVEIVLYVIVYFSTAHLLTFMCVSVGQLARKHKILLSVGVYFGVYFAKQMILTVFLIVGTVGGLYVVIEEILETSYVFAMHAAFIIGIAIEIVGALIYFFIARYIMKNKLNLE